MPEQFELQLVDKLLEKTMENQIDWQPTAAPNILTAAFAGKYTILLRGGMPLGAVLRVKNADDDEIVSLDPSQEPRIHTLYDLAKLYVRAQVDAQLADLIKEIDNSPESDERAKRARLLDKLRALRAKGRLSDMK